MKLRKWDIHDPRKVMKQAKRFGDEEIHQKHHEPDAEELVLRHLQFMPTRIVIDLMGT